MSTVTDAFFSIDREKIKPKVTRQCNEAGPKSLSSLRRCDYNFMYFVTYEFISLYFHFHHEIPRFGLKVYITFKFSQRSDQKVI